MESGGVWRVGVVLRRWYGMLKLLQTSIAMVLEQLAMAWGEGLPYVVAVLYYLGNFPDVFSFDLLLSPSLDAHLCAYGHSSLFPHAWSDRLLRDCDSQVYGIEKLSLFLAVSMQFVSDFLQPVTVNMLLPCSNSAALTPQHH